MKWGGSATRDCPHALTRETSADYVREPGEIDHADEPSWQLAIQNERRLATRTLRTVGCGSDSVVVGSAPDQSLFRNRA